MKDFCVEQSDSADSIALLGEILGAAGVNLEGLCLVTDDGRALVHFAVEDAVTARRVLEHSGIRIRAVSDVVVLRKDERGVTGKPGFFGELCRSFAQNGIRISFGYPAEHNRFVFGVSDVAKARELLE